jgi:hypothetical protein
MIIIMDCRSTNGRVDIATPDTNTLFAMQDRIPVNQCPSYRDANIGNWYDTQLSDVFFSRENIKIIQNGIRAGVYHKSVGAISVGDQSCDELKTIMRSIFLQYAQNRARNVPEQVKELNDLVLAYAVPQVHGEAEAYIKYRRDVSTLVVPIDRPIQSNTNDKQLILNKWF